MGYCAPDIDFVQGCLFSRQSQECLDLAPKGENGTEGTIKIETSG